MTLARVQPLKKGVTGMCQRHPFTVPEDGSSVLILWGYLLVLRQLKYQKLQRVHNYPR